MSIDVRGAVIPYFSEVLAALDEIEEPHALVTLPELSQRMHRALDRLERRIGHLDSWDAIRYALVSWTDSAFKDAKRWRFHEMWQDEQTLEYQLYRTTDFATQFFEESHRMRDAQRHAAMEVFLICGLLGFRGIYGSQLRDKILASHPRFAKSFPIWAEQLALRIQSGKPERPLLDRPIPAEPAIPLRGREMLGNMSMIFGIAASLMLALVVHRLLDPPSDTPAVNEPPAASSQR
jgi:type VI secretion system protein ImpK